MKAIILAAGYATRLGDLTRNRPKPLLPVGGRPMVDFVYEKLQALPQIDEVYLVTNHRFAEAFRGWSAACAAPPVTVLDDGTTSDAEKRGAIGDLLFVVEQAHISDDVLVIAGDNLFRDDLGPFVAFFEEHGSSVALYDGNDRELIKQYSAIEMDNSKRITSFVEKPRDPRTTLMAIAVYAYRREHVLLLRQYRDQGGNMDSPGFFPSWLCRRVPLFGFRLHGPWIDIGSPAEYRRAEELFEEKPSQRHDPANA